MAAATEILSDAERETIIRERLRLHPRPRCQCDACVLSRRLDEARTIALALAEYGHHQIWCLDKHLPADADCQCGWNETHKQFVEP